MPRRGLHPLLHNVTVVLRNGASVTVQSAGRARGPVMLSVVRVEGDGGGAPACPACDRTTARVRA